MRRHLESPRTSRFLSVVILFSLASLAVETYHATDEFIRQLLTRLDVAVVLIFTVEYALRVWTAGTEPRFTGLRGRLRYILTPLAVLDIAAILPAYVGAIGVNLWFLRVPRLFRLLRLGKLARYSTSLQLLTRVLQRKRTELVVVLVASMLLVASASWLMYLAERRAQPVQFSGLIPAFWWAVATVTMVGAPDLAPITAAGKAIAAMLAFVGIGLVALPTGLLTAGFLEEMTARDRPARTCPQCGHTLPHEPQQP